MLVTSARVSAFLTLLVRLFPSICGDGIFRAIRFLVLFLQVPVLLEHFPLNRFGSLCLCFGSSSFPRIPTHSDSDELILDFLYFFSFVDFSLFCAAFCPSVFISSDLEQFTLARSVSSFVSIDVAYFVTLYLWYFFLFSDFLTYSLDLRKSN